MQNVSSSGLPFLLSSRQSSGGAASQQSSLISNLAATASTGSVSAASRRLYAPTAPWSIVARPNPANDAKLLSSAAKEVIAGAKVIDEDAARLDLPNASSDYKKLFALYNGVNTLSQLVDNAKAKPTSAADTQQLQKAFQRGVKEVVDYVSNTRFERLRLSLGEVSTTARAGAGARAAGGSYQTPPLVSTSSEAVSPALSGEVKFNISVTRGGATHNIEIDLSSMPETDRTLINFVGFVNAKLADEGLTTRLETRRIPGQERTTTVAGKPVSLGRTPDSWGLSLKLDTSETVSLEPVASVPAIYLAQRAGNPDPDGKPATKDAVIKNQLVKFQTGADPLSPPNVLNTPEPLASGQVWSKTMDAALTSVRSMHTLADGSVLVLSDATGGVNGQGLRGDRDVILQKFDSAGKLLFSRDLGASDEGFGMSMAVGNDGRIAIAGKVKGKLEGATTGSTTETKGDVSDSFVTVLNAAGEELWTQRRGSRGDDEATNLAWGADGKLYVAGNASTGRGNLDGLGQSDVFLETYSTGPKNTVTYAASAVTGTSGKDAAKGVLVNGNDLYLAANEGGFAVVRRFDLSSGAPVLAETRNLGSLGGGDITGLGMADGRVILTGNTWSGDLTAGNVTNAYSGGQDGFVIRLSASLQPGADDRVTYVGGAGEDAITGVSIKDNRVFITGTSKAAMPGMDRIGTVDGFVSEIDPVTGNSPWSRRFSGKDGFVTPSAIAVDTGGASVLDRLGLPTGLVNQADSLRLDAVSSIRTGDQLKVRSRLNGPTTTITVAEGETLTTLADKMKRAMGGQADVRVMTLDGGRKLQVKPATNRNVVELIAGPEGKDALKALGLPEGALRATGPSRDGKLLPADGGFPIYGLKLNSKINLDNTDEINHAAAELAGAITVIRSTYRALKDAATPEAVKKAEAAQASGKSQVPAYLQKQIANYQDALAKLTGSR
ncbi:MAG: hypothetical protein ACKOD3_09625 [Phenylobacterium sp.]